MKKLLLIILLMPAICSAQRGGLNYPVLTKQQAILQGYRLISTTDSLIKYAKVNDSKLFIEKSFNLTQRCSISGNNVTIVSDKKSTITSNLWFSTPFRFFESFTIIGSNVTFQGLKLNGTDCDVRMIDTVLYQTGIRVYAKDFHLINCELRCWGWCAVYCHRMDGCLVEQCYIGQTKNNGYGYSVWYEGLPNQIAIARNNIFEDCRESIDAGGQWTYWTVTGNVSDRVIGSHEQPNGLAGIGTTIQDNYLFPKRGVDFPLPNDTGYLIIKNNFFLGDSANSIWLSGKNDLARVSVTGNHFNGEGMNLPACSLRVDSIRGHTVDFAVLSPYMRCEVYYGDGTPATFIASGIIHHIYKVNGTYFAGIRTFDGRGVPSVISYTKIVIGTGLNFAFKTTARFQPASGYYQVQIVIDDSVYEVFDIVKHWSWMRISRDYKLTGVHKLAIRLKCLRDCINPLMVWFDDIDYNGKILNPSFETPYYQPPVSYWRYRGVSGPGNTVTLGAGSDYRERCGGDLSWRFEFRPDTIPVRKGTYAEIYQSVNFSIFAP